MPATPPPRPRAVPWYRRHDEWMAQARAYMSAWLRVPRNAPHQKEMASFRRFTAIRLIFESNLIEGAGLPEGETHRVVQDYFPRIPDDWESFQSTDFSVQALAHSGPKELERLRRIVTNQGLSAEKVIPSVSFENRSRGVQEVIRHFLAYYQAQRLAQRVISRRALHGMTIALMRDPAFRQRLKLVWMKLPRTPAPELRYFARALEGRLTPQEYRPSALLTEADIRGLHRGIAQGLLPDDVQVSAGEYRTDERAVGLDVAFPSPALVPAAMSRWVQLANERLLQPPKPVSTAAFLSYEFVRIHPFPDFNGRLSRLILNVVLWAGLVPFALALRGDKTGRHRYLRALKQANKGNLRDYEALIAMDIVGGFREVDENLTRASLGSVLSFHPRRRRTQSADEHEPGQGGAPTDSHG